MSLDKFSILFAIIITRQTKRTSLDADSMDSVAVEMLLTVSARERGQRKKRLFRAAHKEARKGGKISGKAMQDEFWAYAKTLVMEKSKSLG
jgi:hypothetical protein